VHSHISFVNCFIKDDTRCEIHTHTQPSTMSQCQNEKWAAYNTTRNTNQISILIWWCISHIHSKYTHHRYSWQRKYNEEMIMITMMRIHCSSPNSLVHIEQHVIHIDTFMLWVQLCHLSCHLQSLQHHHHLSLIDHHHLSCLWVFLIWVHHHLLLVYHLSLLLHLLI